MKKIFLVLLNFSFLFLLSVNNSLAHVTPGPACPAIPPHIQTALGCIDTEPARLASDIIGIAVGVGGGLAFLFLISGAFKLITSGGDPDNIQAAKERITSAIAGLLLIVFSVVILRIIGVDILKIPGFTRSGNYDIGVPGP